MPTTPLNATVLFLPGWQDSGEGHWQTLWEAEGLGRKLVQDDWLWPKRGDWMARLDEALLARPPDAEPVVLVAHSLGCQLVAAWAAHSAHTRRVQAALLVAPPDTEREDMPPQLHSWRPMPRHPLPFRSMAVLSTNDPYGELSRCSALASDWGLHPGDRGPTGAPEWGVRTRPLAPGSCVAGQPVDRSPPGYFSPHLTSEGCTMATKKPKGLGLGLEALLGPTVNDSPAGQAWTARTLRPPCVSTCCRPAAISPGPAWTKGPCTSWPRASSPRE